MAEKVKSFIYFLDNYEWINIITGIIMLITSIGLLINYSASISQVVIIIGLMSILKGFLNFNVYLTSELSKRDKKGAGSFLFGAFTNLIIGIMLILNIYTNPIFLIFLTSLWMIIDSIPYVIYLFKNRLGHRYKHNPFILTYACIFLLAIAMLWTLRTHLFGPVIPLAGFLILSILNLSLLERAKK